MTEIHNLAVFTIPIGYSGDREQLSEGWRTGVRVMPNSRSEATLSFKYISKNIR
jgi:hypothetical protein